MTQTTEQEEAIFVAIRNVLNKKQQVIALRGFEIDVLTSQIFAAVREELGGAFPDDDRRTTDQ